MIILSHKGGSLVPLILIKSKDEFIINYGSNKLGRKLESEKLIFPIN